MPGDVIIEPNGFHPDNIPPIPNILDANNYTHNCEKFAMRFTLFLHH